MRLLLCFLLALGAHAGTLPGFRIDKVSNVPGFVSSVVVDSKGVVYCTTTDGWIHRVDGGTAVPIASLPTHAGGNGGLLGMALLDDSTAAVHYTTWSGEKVLDDVISTVDLATGAEHVLESFACDVEFRERGVSDEHHGGNLTVANGTIFVGIGEYGAHAIAQKPEWNGGKIWRLDREGNATQYAMGMRNPYDLAWDPQLGRLVVSDNGDKGGDEINVIETGVDCGWPQVKPTSVAPDYVFPSTVAPTGLARMSGKNGVLRRGYLLGAFVTRALYYFPDLATRPIPDPVAVVSNFSDFIIDVAEGPDGEIYLATAAMNGTSAIQRLSTPPRGDCNGDGLTNSQDILPTIHEIGDGEAHPMVTAQDGNHAGSWGCDANADSLIDGADLDALVQMLGSRRRAVRR